MGDFNHDGLLDVVAADPTTQSLVILAGRPGGGLANAQRLPIAITPGALAVGDLNGDGIPDLVVLDPVRGVIEVFLGTAAGGFLAPVMLGGQPLLTAVGNEPVALTLQDVNGDGKLDLAVSNAFGDVLLLRGNGDGTFTPFVRPDGAPLALNASGGTAAPLVLVGNQGNDTVSVVQRVPDTDTFTAPIFNDNHGVDPNLLAPGAVTWANLDGHTDGLLDAIVVSSGGNAVLIYHNTPTGLSPTPDVIFVGADPTAVLVADLNGSAPELIVANTGSNDVSVLFGSTASGRWTVTNQERRNAGQGPTGLTLLHNGSLAVTDGASGQVVTLANRGNGFFDDSNLQPVTVSSGPIGNLVSVTTSINLPGGVLPGGGSELALTADGRVLGINLETGATQFLTPAGDVAAFGLLQTPGGAPQLVTANLDHSVTLLTDTNAQGFSETLNIPDATTGTPSALEVLDNAAGVPEAYLTDAGDSTPIVLTLDLRAELTGVGGGGGNTGDLGAGAGGQGSGLGGGLSLVAVLVTDVSVAGTGGVNQGPAAETFNPLALALTQAVDTGLLAPGEAAALAADEQVATLGQVLATLIVLPGGGGDNPGDEPPDGGAGGPERPTLQQFLADYMGALERLRQGAANETDDELIEGVRLWLRGWIDNWEQKAPQPQDEAPDLAEPPALAPAAPVAEEQGPAPEMAGARRRAEREQAADLVFGLAGEWDGPRGPWTGRRDALSALLAGAALVAGAQALAGDALARPGPRGLDWRRRNC
jgi:hypothetical protein